MTDEIVKIIAREILDSRGYPTVEAEVHLQSGHWGRAAVPSGASTGSREALELRDTNEPRYNGKGVQSVVKTIETIFHRALVGYNPTEQTAIDKLLIDLDGTPNKSKYGANATLAVSLAVAQAAAASQKRPLYHYLSNATPRMPVPLMNVINGGQHADNKLDIQEFMIVPAGAASFREALQYGAETYHAIKSILKSRGLQTAVGDEGGFAPDLASNEAAIEILLEGITLAGFMPGKDVFLAIDCAASEFYQDGKYHLAAEGLSLTSEDFIEYLARWVNQYPIISLEDALDEQDWKGWAWLSKKLGGKIQLVGDDLFVTNTQILSRGIDQQIANAILIKLNQIGTLTETFAAIEMAKAANYGAIISHRSGETEDTVIADLAVATGVGQIKTGAPCRTERVAKYNQLLRIEGQESYPYAGIQAFE